MRIGVLFDLDGTLLDTLEDLRDATNYALAVHGFPQRSLGQIRAAVGNGAANQIRCSLPEGTEETVVQQVLATYKPYYTAHCRHKTGPYAGVVEALKEIRGKYPVAIVSNKPDGAVKALCGMYFEDVFSLGERAECPRKPAPDMLKQAMDAIGAERCVYVGDSEVDILTADNAGVPCLCVLWGFRDREALERAGGKHFCEETTQLLEKLEEIMHGK